LLAGVGDVVERARLIAEREAVDQQEPPAFEVGKKTLVESGFVPLLVKFLDAAGFEIVEREQIPKFLAPFPEVVEHE